MENKMLEHSGVLGMKWGHKKAGGWSPSDSVKKHIEKVASKKVAVPNSDDHNKTIALKAKKLNTMSNVEIRAFNERVQLERTYKQLTKKDIKPGRKFVTDMLVNNGKQAVTAFVAAYISKQVGVASPKINDLIKEILTPKPPSSRPSNGFI